MKLIRNSIFETNSSSTHSLTMCMKETYDKWKNGELFFMQDDNTFYTPEERKNMMKQSLIKNKTESHHIRQEDEEGNFKGYDSHYIYKGVDLNTQEAHFTQENLDEITDEMLKEADDNGEIDYYFDVPVSYEEYMNSLDLESYYEEFVTPEKETVVGFGYFGYDG